MNGLALKELAHNLATVMHDGQCRKGTGEPYVYHVERIADSLQGWQLKTVAYLHDLVEDTPVTFDVLTVMFPIHIVCAVDLLTRREGETYFEFIDRTVTAAKLKSRGSELALPVKIADVRDNLRDIHDLPGDFESLEKRYTTALARLLEASGEDPE